MFSVNKKWETFQAAVVDRLNGGIIPAVRGRGGRREVCKKLRKQRAEIRAMGMTSIQFIRRGQVKKKGVLNCKKVKLLN